MVEEISSTHVKRAVVNPTRGYVLRTEQAQRFHPIIRPSKFYPAQFPEEAS